MIQTRRRFGIPPDIAIMTMLIQAVPDSWKWLSGFLKAPDGMIRYGEAVSGTGFHFARGVEVLGVDPSGKVAKPNYQAILFERKSPAFLAFEDAGLSSPYSSFIDAKDLAIKFVGQGYLGRLKFYRDSNHNDYNDNSARCFFYLTEHGRGEDRYPPLISVEWEDNEDVVIPILTLVESLGLPEIKDLPEFL